MKRGNLLNNTIIIAIISSLGAAVVSAIVTLFIGWRKWPAERRVTEAESQDKISASYERLVDDLNGRIDQLQGELDAEKKRSQQRIEKLEKRQRERDTDMNRLRGDLIGHQDQIRKLEHERRELLERLHAQDIKLEKQESEISRLRDILKEAGIPNGSHPGSA